MDLYWEEVYVVDMTLEVCLETDSACQTSVTVLKDTILPKVLCSWSILHKDKGK